MRRILFILVFILYFNTVVATDVFVNAPGKVKNNVYFPVNIGIDATEDVYAFALNLNFNPTKIEAVSVSEGGFLKKDGKSTWSMAPTINNIQGTITNIAVTRIGTQTGVSGTGNLVTVNFHSKNMGSSVIGLSNVIVVNPLIEQMVVSSHDDVLMVGLRCRQPFIP